MMPATRFLSVIGLSSLIWTSAFGQTFPIGSSGTGCSSSTPCSVSIGGSGATTGNAALDNFSGASGSAWGLLARNIAGQWAAYNNGYIDMKLQGAGAGGDDTAIINTSVATAKSTGLALYFPCGTYNHSNSSAAPTFDSIRVF